MAPSRVSTASIPAAWNFPTTAANELNRCRSHPIHGCGTQSGGNRFNVQFATLGGDPASAGAGHTGAAQGRDGSDPGRAVAGQPAARQGTRAANAARKERELKVFCRKFEVYRFHHQRAANSATMV